jgi:hypothetical protein
MLYLNADGFAELKIPIEVSPSEGQYNSMEAENDDAADGEFLTL